MSPTMTPLPPLTSHGHVLDGDPEHLGLMRDSSGLLGDYAALRRRMEEDGYLYLPGFHTVEDVLAARRGMIERIAAEGFLHPDHDPMEGILAPGKGGTWNPSLADRNPSLRHLLYEGRVIEFFEGFLRGEIRYFNYTWVRVMGPGQATPPHCDIVYMGRGTQQLYTVWTPIGDAPCKVGGLIMLEGSHQNKRLRNTYGKHDVDAYCANKSGPAAQTAWERKTNGHLSKNPNQIRRSIGGRWLTADYRAGDIVIFSAYTVHASTDNCSDRLRLSTDSRYQLASEPADDRWVGKNPSAHGGRKGLIC